MPGWHDATADLQAQGKVKMVGVLEEQHPERALLFHQWKHMEWPLLVDSLNLLEVPFVPITLLVDETGHARRAPRLRSGEEIRKTVLAFLEEGSDPDAPASTSEPADGLPVRTASAPARPVPGDAASLRQYGRRLFSSRGEAGLDDAIAAYEQALDEAPEDPGGWGHFRLGVLRRARYDSPHRQEGDFQAAVDRWQAALDRDPNNYIFRRRIQQYGPRLDKPYPFYDWVTTAQQEIRARGEEPMELELLPGGAEIAEPASADSPSTVATAPAQPDPEGRIQHDPGKLVQVETTVVRGTAERGGDPSASPLQVHLAFRPNEGLKVHWNNEAEGLTVWLDPVPGVEVEPRRLTVPNPTETLSVETRRLDFEVVAGEVQGRSVELPGYALYYVCEDVDGTCLYRRQDLQVRVRLGWEAGEGGQSK